MIKIKCKIGNFEVTDGKLVEGDRTIQAFFNIATGRARPIQVSEGPIDYAIAKRMVDMIGGPWDNLGAKYPEQVDNQPN